jgi:hypothetical protein
MAFCTLTGGSARQASLHAPANFRQTSGLKTSLQLCQPAVRMICRSLRSNTIEVCRTGDEAGYFFDWVIAVAATDVRSR